MSSYSDLSNKRRGTAIYSFQICHPLRSYLIALRLLIFGLSKKLQIFLKMIISNTFKKEPELFRKEHPSSARQSERRAASETAQRNKYIQNVA